MRHLLALFISALLALSCQTDPNSVRPLDLVPQGELTAPEALPGADTMPPSPTLKVMTFNVLCFFCNDVEYDPWEERLAYFGDLFARHTPDLVGLQELLFATEVDQILAVAPGYSALFFQDPAQSLFKEYADAAILYRTDRFQVVEHGFYWLSETPDIALAGGWAQSNLPRLVAWAHLRGIEDQREFYFATTHFDNNPPNQDMSAPLFVQRTQEWAASMPAIVVGDFNSKPASTAYAVLTTPARLPHLTLQNAFDLADGWRVEANQEPPPDYHPDHRIDHIFVAGDVHWKVPEWVVDMTVYGPHERYPSDHFAMTATLSME